MRQRRTRDDSGRYSLASRLSENYEPETRRISQSTGKDVKRASECGELRQVVEYPFRKMAGYSRAQEKAERQRRQKKQRQEGGVDRDEAEGDPERQLGQVLTKKQPGGCTEKFARRHPETHKIRHPGWAAVVGEHGRQPAEHAHHDDEPFANRARCSAIFAGGVPFSGNKARKHFGQNAEDDEGD